MKPTTAVIPVAVAATGLLACSTADDGQPAVEPNDAGADVATVPGRTDLCAEAVVPTGFGLGWDRLNHRIAVYSVSYDPTAAVSCNGSTGAHVAAQFVGGDFSTGEVASDTPIVRTSYAVVGAHEPGVQSTPTLEIAFGQVQVDIDATQTASAELPDLTLQSPASTTVLAVAGLGLYTDVPQDPDYPSDYDPALGYTSNGMAVSIQPGSPAQTTVRFGLAEADRENMNAAIAYARTKAMVQYMKVGVIDGALTTHTHTISHDYPEAEVFDSTPLPPIPSEKTRVTIAGQPGFEQAVAVLTTVDFELFRSTPGHGDYIREMSIGLNDPSYDPASGTMSLTVGAYASNASLLTEGPMQVDATVGLTLVQFNGGGTVAHVQHDQSFEVLTVPANIPLPLEPAKPVY